MKNFYTIDKNTLELKEVNYLSFIFVSFGILVLLFLSSFISPKIKNQKEIRTEIEVLLKQDNIFTEEKLIEEIKNLKLEHPEIILAQSYIESGRFNSIKFKKNNNLFAMRKAGSRVSTCNKVDDNGFAIYKNWKESLLDYAFLQSSFARNLTETEYFMWLESYTHESNYGKLIKKIIKQEKLKEKFDE